MTFEEMAAQAREDGYVECSECGHAVEQHGINGCEICDCSKRWTRMGVRKLRVKVGLPAEWL
jgi:hypothetical protein